MRAVESWRSARARLIACCATGRRRCFLPRPRSTRTNQRRYASAQAGRVRAIAALRAVGFGLDTIRDLLDQGLTESRLVDLLRQRETELADRIAQDSTALAQVRTRLRWMGEDRNAIMNTLESRPCRRSACTASPTRMSAPSQPPWSVPRPTHPMRSPSPPLSLLLPRVPDCICEVIETVSRRDR